MGYDHTAAMESGPSRGASGEASMEDSAGAAVARADTAVAVCGPHHCRSE